MVIICNNHKKQKKGDVMKVLTSLVTVFFVGFSLVGCQDGSDVEKKESLTPLTQEGAQRTINALNMLSINTIAPSLVSSVPSDATSSSMQQITPSIPDGVSCLTVMIDKDCPISGKVSVSGCILPTEFDVTNYYAQCETLPGIFVNGTNHSFGELVDGKLHVNTDENDIKVTKGNTEFFLRSDIVMLFDYRAHTVNIQLNGTNTVTERYPDLEGYLAEYALDFYDFNITQNLTNNTMVLSGELSLYLESCVDSSIYIDTEVPLVADERGIFTSGALLLNDAYYEFNDDGTVDISYGDYYNFTYQQGLEAVCPYEFFEELY